MDELKDMLLDKGASLVAYADLGILPPQARHNLRYGISLAVALNPEIIAGIKDGPTREYYVESQRMKELLATLSLAAVDYLRSQGHLATATDVPAMSTDYTTLRAPFQHKTVATRGGLGWIGKCALLITERFGAAVRLTSILTDAELPVDPPVESSRCGECSDCAKICSAKASLNRNWHASMDRSSFFDAFACYKAAKARAREIGIDKAICGICIAACPWTREYLVRAI